MLVFQCQIGAAKDESVVEIIITTLPAQERKTE
jgi:hypothetical protein